MANELTQPSGGDPYSSYGARVDKTGAYLSFKNGEYNYGKIGAKLELGTRMVADMPGLRVGWKCWKGGRVVADLMNLLTDNDIALRRNLGDDDQDLWDCDERGQPRDPWQFVNELTLCRDDGENFVFSTSSRGGIGAIGK